MQLKEPINEFIEYLYPNSSEIILGDTLYQFKKIEDEKFDLTITLPPYNIGKKYETKTSIEKYLKHQEKVIKELVRVTSNKGSICWQVGNYVEKGEIFPLDIYYLGIPATVPTFDLKSSNNHENFVFMSNVIYLN